MANVSIPEAKMLKKSSTLAVSVPINFFIKLGFVSVNGSRETYFVDKSRISLHLRLGAGQSSKAAFAKPLLLKAN